LQTENIRYKVWPKINLQAKKSNINGINQDMSQEINSAQLALEDPIGFYLLDDSDKSSRFEALAREALGHWGLTGAALRLIKQRENAVFAVTTREGERYALRIHRAGYHIDAELNSELEWMSALDQFGVRTPEVVPAADGALFQTVCVSSIPEPRQVDLLGWVDGAAIGSIEDGVEDVAAVSQSYRVVGQLVARMHQFARQWVLPAGFIRHEWDEDGLLGAEPWWGRFWELEALDSPQRDLLLRAREAALVELADYGKSVDRYGLIHADPLPENFLRGDDGEVRVIDFDDGGFGWFIFDFATALFFHLGEPWFDELLGAMLAGYQEVKELPPEFEARLPLFLLLRGFSYLGWAHTRKETDTARELTPMLVEGVTALASEYLSINHPDNHR
jgi:Ser/Thr protein kinase RdoA (MazF antagonist)